MRIVFEGFITCEREKSRAKEQSRRKLWLSDARWVLQKVYTQSSEELKERTLVNGLKNADRIMKNFNKTYQLWVL